MANKNEKMRKDDPKSADKPKKKWTIAKVTKLFWVALAILIFLLIFSIVVLCARMYSYAKLEDEGDVIKIKADSVENFDLFSAEYKDGNGKVVVKSDNGDPVVAPGTGDEYTIRIKNEDDVAVKYSFKPIIKYEGTDSLPMEIRLISPDEEYLIGGPKDWKPFDSLVELKELVVTLPKGEIDSYELQWRWLYESGDDARDTALANGNVSISVGMQLYTEADTSSTANGGIFGLGINDMLWWLIFFILLLIAIILLILSLITRKKDPEPVVVYVPTPEPAPAPAPAPAPIVIAPYKKNKGFVGKMEYVNIDTLVLNFNNGDTVSLKILKEKGLVGAKATQVKILARADMVINKALHIETQGISAQAKQKIIAAGGTVKITEG